MEEYEFALSYLFSNSFLQFICCCRYQFNRFECVNENWFLLIWILPLVSSSRKQNIKETAQTVFHQTRVESLKLCMCICLNDISPFQHCILYKYSVRDMHVLRVTFTRCYSYIPYSMRYANSIDAFSFLFFIQ